MSLGSISSEVLALAVEELREVAGLRVSTASADRGQHGRDESRFPPAEPDAVVFANATEDVAEVVRVCGKHRVPLIAFGAGTSVEGHVLAVRGGIALDLRGMSQVLEVNPEDLDCRVEAGVTRLELEHHLKGSGLFFPVDPGADATIGGMAATAASGTNSVRYGTMRENVLGLTAVLADGRTIRTGTRARKSSAGYDLTRLLVGSEGTLAVITEVQLRLYGVPETISAAICQFDDLAGPVRTVIETIQLEIPVARMELLDEYTVAAVIAYSDLEELDTAPTLLMEFHGSEQAVAEQLTYVQGIASANGGSRFRTATAAEERNNLWRARHDVLYACLAARPGARPIATDCCVPISRLAECLAAARADIDANELVAPLLGHVGDGNYHAVFLVDPSDADELARAEAVNERMVRHAIAVGGTCTGEHGIGIGKRGNLQHQFGDAVSVMRDLKDALDPHEILNPGKVLYSHRER